jgi:sec-independent protein translocase protein TatA
MGFDALAPWHIILLLVVLVLLFGSRRLPGAAKSLGESMHIFKRSVAGLNAEDDTAANPAGANPVNAAQTTMPPTVPATQQLTAAQAPTQAQLEDLQRQVQELQRQAAASANNGQASETQANQPF